MSVDWKRVNGNAPVEKSWALRRPASWRTCRLAAMRFLTIAPGVLPEVAKGIGERRYATFRLPRGAMTIADATLPGRANPPRYSKAL
jgi:hypothetical protein